MSGMLVKVPKVQNGQGTELTIAERWRAMNAQEDQIKGHIKEVAGLLADDKELEDQGKSERHAAQIQEKLDQVRDVMHDVVDKTQDKVDGLLDKSKDALKSK